MALSRLSRLQPLYSGVTDDCQKNVLALLAGICGLVVLSVGAFLLLIDSILSGPVINQRPFDAEERRRVGESEARQGMVDGFLQNHNPVGLTREEVVELLGEPPETTYFSDYDLVYWVGIERGFIRIDSEWLVIRIDDNEKVTEARLVSD